MWPWGGFARFLHSSFLIHPDVRLGRHPPECVILTHSSLVVFDLGAGSGYFSFTEKPDLLLYQVFLVFRKGT